MPKVVVTPPQIDTALFKPGPKYEDLIVSVGRLSPEKNHAPLILAVAELPWAKLLVIGDGPLRKELTGLVCAVNGSAPMILLLGTLPNAKVAELLAQATYFVLPSLYDQAPKALWEAMSAECACIVSAQVGVVEEGVTGYLCTPDVSGIRAALERARTDPKRSRMAQNARRLVHSLFYVAEGPMAPLAPETSDVAL